jgi:uncharacterized protein YecT (DUF1311 family)
MNRHLRHCFLGLTALLLSILVMAAPPTAELRTVVGVVDGQKFGTNLLGESASVTFEGDSGEESRLLEACNLGDRCKVVVVTGKADVVTRLISAERVPVAAKSEPGASATSAAPPTGPSFSCSKATTPVERTICADPALSVLDRELAAAYRKILERNATERRQIQQQQREWVGAQRNACKDAACLRAAYQQRLQHLAQ